MRQEWALIEDGQDDDDARSESESGSVAPAGESDELMPDVAMAGLPGHIELQDAGLRLEEDWARAYRAYGAEAAEGMRTFVDEQKRELGDAEYDHDFSSYDEAKLGAEQRRVLGLLKHAAHATSGQQEFCVVRGGGGVGKSYVINCFRKWLASDGRSLDWAVVLAPTGTAANNISGFTLHSKLKLPAPTNDNTFKPLSDDSLAELQDLWMAVRVALIDEMSMVGRRTLRCIDLRLREATGRHDVVFGGMSVFLFGDFGQLPPVADLPMFAMSTGGGPLSRAGIETFGECTSSVVLTANFRQTDAAHKKMLWNLRCGSLSKKDYALIATRTAHAVGKRGLEEFADAPHIAATREEVHDVNVEKLKKLGAKVFRIEALHKGGHKAKSATDAEAGLPRTLILAPGVKVMLLRNYWTSKGLTNGSTGKVVEVISSSNGSMPLCVLVEFSGYTGPAFDADRPRVVPITPHTQRFGDGDALTRTQIPLALAYAFTIHKAQGATFSKCSISLGSREMTSNLSYTALSRVTTLSGFVLRGVYHEARLMKLNKAKHHQARAEAEDWLDSLGSGATRRRGKRAGRNAPAPKTAKRQKKSRA